MPEENRRFFDLGDGRELELPEPDFQRLKSLAALERLTPQAWLGRHWVPKEPGDLGYGGPHTEQGE